MLLTTSKISGTKYNVINETNFSLASNRLKYSVDDVMKSRILTDTEVDQIEQKQKQIRSYQKFSTNLMRLGFLFVIVLSIVAGFGHPSNAVINGFMYGLFALGAVSLGICAVWYKAEKSIPEFGYVLNNPVDVLTHSLSSSEANVLFNNPSYAHAVFDIPRNDYFAITVWNNDELKMVIGNLPEKDEDGKNTKALSLVIDNMTERARVKLAELDKDTHHFTHTSIPNN